MNRTVAIPAVRHAVVVEAPRARAFEVFTISLDRWWIRDWQIGKESMHQVVMEPRRGGRVYERGVNGTECDWGRVLEWEPPVWLVVAWQIDGDWQFDADLAHASEYEVLFVEETPVRTRVEFEHRHFERHGSAGQSIHDQVQTGWANLLAVYASTAKSS